MFGFSFQLFLLNSILSFPRRIMNQHRWNCLTALFLSTFIAPISNVRAEVTPPAASGNNNFFPQSSPIPTTVTPTQPQVDLVVSVVRAVPQVSSIPIVTALGSTKKRTPTKQFKTAKIGIFLPTKQTHLPSPVVQVAATAANFSPNLRTTTQIATFSNSIESSFTSIARIDSSSGTVGAVAPLPQITATPAAPGSKPFTTQAASAPIFVSRSDNAKLTKALIPPTIKNSAAVPAEMTVTPIIEESNPAIGQSDVNVKTATKIIPSAIANPAAGTEPTLVPKVAPLATYPQDRAEIPSFESGLPVFIFEDDKPPQIVATAIAQVGNDIVAPEPSIAIPVERPKQATVPTQIPVTTPTISKIDPAATTNPVLDKIVSTQTGQASWYGSESGNRTASGERFNPAAMTAAHRTLPFGTMVKVTNLKTGKTVVVRINDRGPFRSRRIVDLSAGAAEIIGLKSHGVGDVRMDILEPQG
jgi:rare lipoprotein A